MHAEDHFSINKVISFLSGKGGTGKTSIVSNLGIQLALKGNKVLLIDMDFFTRGLTFYVTKGQTSFESSVMDILRGKKGEPIKIKENLYLLPSVAQSLDLSTSTQIENIFKSQKKRFSEEILRLKTEFDFILLDQRSGIDPLTISSALYSDKYIIVTEEDRTSQRASYLLMKALAEHALSLEEIRGGKFLGFIINMYTTAFGKDLIRFLETSVFEGKCLAAIPHFATVRKTFVRDEFMIEKYPRHGFSLEISALLDALSGQDVIPPSKRVKNRKGNELFLPMLTAGATVYAFAISYILYRKEDIFDPIRFLTPIIPFLILAMWIYFRKD